MASMEKIYHKSLPERTEYRILFTERTTGLGSDVIITKNVREKL